MVRAHQCKEEGVGFAYTDNRKDVFTFPYVTTLFSAANYCGSYGNKAALLVFYQDDIQVPYYLEHTHNNSHAFIIASTANRRPCAAIQVCAFIIKLLTMQLSGVHLIELCYYNNSDAIRCMD